MTAVNTTEDVAENLEISTNIESGCYSSATYKTQMALVLAGNDGY